MGLGTCSFFLLEDYFKVGHHGSKFLKQSPSILLNVDTWWFAHIRLGERWHGNHFSKPFGIGNHNHIKYQTWIIHFIQTSHQSSSASLISLLLCWSKSYMYYYYYVFFLGLSCTKSCSNACFFFAVCRAPNRAPMRAFSRGLSCTKSCSTLWFLAWCVFWEIVAGGFSECNLPWRYWLLVVVLTKLEDWYLYFELISSCTKWC